jgi:hypothetical protein
MADNADATDAIVTRYNLEIDCVTPWCRRAGAPSTAGAASPATRRLRGARARASGPRSGWWGGSSWIEIGLARAKASASGRGTIADIPEPSRKREKTGQRDCDPWHLFRSGHRLFEHGPVVHFGSPRQAAFIDDPPDSPLAHLQMKRR